MKKESIILKPIVLLLLIYCQYAMGQDTCHTFLSRLQAKYPTFSSLTEQESFYVKYSGIRGQRDIGDRKGCEKQPSMNYYVLLRRQDIDGIDVRNQEETGICVIKECTKEMLRNDKALMISFMRLNSFPVNEWEIIELYDLHEPVPKSVIFYLCALLHFAVVTFSICCTIIIYKRQKQRQRPEILEATPEVSNPQNHYLMEAFDLRATLKDLYRTAQEQKQNENLAVFGFLKTFTGWWIVFYHAVKFINLTAMAFRPPPLGRFGEIITFGILGVDCFFFVGGFLAVYVLSPKLQKEKLTLKSLFFHMKHRFMRIWPLCMAAILFYIYIARYMFTGAMWGRYDVVEDCSKHWLSKIFLVDNLVMEVGGVCAGWTWYASVDLQCYIIILLIISVYVESRLRGYLFTVLFIILSFIIADYSGDDVYTYYVFTPARMNEMLIGVLLGMHYYEYAKLKLKVNMYWICERFVIAKYLVLLCGIGIWYYVIHYFPINPSFPKRWYLVSKCLICLSAGVTFAPMNAQIPFWLKSFLNLRIFQILGKLSFGSYLFHIPVIWIVLYTRDHSLEFTSSFLTETPKIILGATIVATFYWIFLERPLQTIEARSHKKRHPPSLTVANSKEALQQLSNQANSDVKNGPIELSTKQPEHRTSSPKPAIPLEIEKKYYLPLQEV